MVNSLQQEMARLSRIRLDHLERHNCGGFCDEAAYMQQLLNDGHRWQEEGLVRQHKPEGIIYEIGDKIRKALILDIDAQSDPVRCALLIYETLAPGEILTLEQFEHQDPVRALYWTRGVLREGGAQFVFTT